MQSRVWDKCFTEIEALNTEGELGKSGNSCFGLRFMLNQRGWVRLWGAGCGTADDAVAVAPTHPYPCATGPPPRVGHGGDGTGRRDQTHNCCRRGDGEGCPGRGQGRWRRGCGSNLCPGARPLARVGGIPVIPPGSPAATNTLITIAAGAARRRQRMI